MVSGIKIEPLPHEKVLKLGGGKGVYIPCPVYFFTNPISIPTFLFLILSPNDPDPIFPVGKKDRRIQFAPSVPSHVKFTRCHLHIKSGYNSDRLFNSGSNIENSFPVMLSTCSVMRTLNILKPF